MARVVRKYRKKPATKKPVDTTVSTTTGEVVVAKSFQEALQELISFHLINVSEKRSLLAPPRKLPRAKKQRGPLCLIYSLDRNEYAKMLAVIMRGASIDIAAIWIGINPETFVRWKRQGLEDIRFGIDSHFARFVHDINFAATVATIEAETKVHDESPLEWLRNGPGRWMHAAGTWQQARDSQPSPVEIPETTGLAISGPDQEDSPDDIDLMSTAPTIQDLPEALIAMRQVGLGHVIEDSIEEAKKRNDAHADRIKEEGSRNTPQPGHSSGTPGTNGKATG